MIVSSEAWLSGVADLIGARLVDVAPGAALLEKTSARALTLIGDDGVFREWSAIGRFGKFEPPLSPANYDETAAAGALMIAFAAAFRLRREGDVV